ncbi:protein FAM13A isoform X2 [Phymastichus coffea]|uniref:protein FAM13A isoform X2 n=1 Tax=Phymastichus coffea TaxID=108790 RepID=UPI00273C4ABE|nr:protein FAM13A isoform X2 [Phymastichus coffea]
MRGPESSQPAQQQQQQQVNIETKDESRLARVKRVLWGQRNASNASTSNDGNSNRVLGFGVDLEVAERHIETGVPYVVHRLCHFIESHGFRNPTLFRLAGGSSKLADKLRLAFERRGDADLEGAGCPATAALLLRQYLKELPRAIVGPTCVSKLLQLHAHERIKNRECWIVKTRDLLANELGPRQRRLLGYVVHFLSRFEAQHGCAAGVCGIFAPILLPHVPPATVLLRDLMLDAALIFPDYSSGKESIHGVIPSSDCKLFDEENKDELAPPSKRKDRRDSCGQERKLIRSNSVEKIWEGGQGDTGENNNEKSADAIRRVSSHEDFNSAKHLHILSKLQKDIMGHGPRHGGLPLHERTNASPVSSKTSLVHSSDVVLAEKYNLDAERMRSSERFSRSINPRGRRQQGRRRKLSLGSILHQSSSKENERDESEPIFTLTADSNKTNSQSQSFLEMFTTGPSRSPSPVRPTADDANNPTLAKFSFQIQQGNNDEMGGQMISPRNSLLMPRRFYGEDEPEDHENIISIREYGLRNLMKQINNLKKRIKKYEGEFEDNFGYRPSHSDKMGNRDIKKIVSELSKVRKEHKILKEGFTGSLLSPKLSRDDIMSANNNNNGEEMLRASTMAEMVKEVDRKLSEKRLKYKNRPENLEDLTFEQLLDEKTAVQKALLQIESTFGRPVSKEDRSIVRPLYDKYRTLKRLLMKAGANNDSIGELATILEHEAMDFSSASGNPVDCERRASEPDMSHRGIADCIDSMDQVPTDSDSQHSSSESSRGVVESLHSLSKDELIEQQRITREEKKRLRRSLKELEMQFEARAGRRMQRKDRGSQVNVIYDSYKQTKAKLRLISALLAKSP